MRRDAAVDHRLRVLQIDRRGGRKMIRSTGVWSILLVFACGVTLAAEEPAPRALGSPHYVLELPSLASPADVTRGERLLETLVKHTRAIFGTAAELDAAYRAFVIDRSAAINARKLGENADAVK